MLCQSSMGAKNILALKLPLLHKYVCVCDAVHTQSQLVLVLSLLNIALFGVHS